MKSKSAAKKRYRFTASGKVKVQRPGRRHNLSQKAAKRKRGLRPASYLPEVLADKVKKQLPYGSR